MSRLLNAIAKDWVDRGVTCFNRFYHSTEPNCLIGRVPCSSLKLDIHIIRTLQSNGGSLFEPSAIAAQLAPLLPRLRSLRKDYADTPFRGWIRWRLNQDMNEIVDVSHEDREWANELRLLRANYSAVYPIADWDFADCKTRSAWASAALKDRSRIPPALSLLLKSVDLQELELAAAMTFPSRKLLRELITSTLKDVFHITKMEDGLVRYEYHFGDQITLKTTIDIERPTLGFSQRAHLCDNLERFSINADPLIYAGFNDIEWDMMSSSNAAESVLELKNHYLGIIQAVEQSRRKTG